MVFFRASGSRILLVAVGIAAVAGVAGAIAFYLAFVRDLPDLHDARDYEPALASHVVDRNGRPIGEFFSERRTLTPLAEVPEHVVQAFVAGEDSTFFEHSGIDYVSILRAIWVNLRAGGEIRQGASTITQQTVKGLFLTPERKFRRKIREMILAHRIEERFSKQDILYLYLNQIYFGQGAYGIGEAARTYFGKEVSELDVSEGALLAGLPKAPSRYSPVAHPEAAEMRRRYVLDRMLAEEIIDRETYATALLEPPAVLEPHPNSDAVAASYFVEEVRRLLFDTLGSDTVLRGGLQIETTLDSELQKAAVAAVQKGLVALDRRQGYRGPLRQVAGADIAAEVERLAETNGLATAFDDDAAVDADAGALPLAPEQIYEGVVTVVDVEAKTAQVAFAPDITATVALADVRWAREPDPKRSPRRVRAIEKVFSVGDVAPFRLRPESDEDSEDTAQVLRVVLHQEPIAQGALLSVDLERDEVIAMVGGYDFAKSQFNRVTQARRQPGSAFKPLIYSAALMQGYTSASILFDRPIVYADEESGFVWRPRNYKGTFYGPITLREALVRSVNNATVHLFRDIGVDYVIDYARRLGIESPLNRDLSLALGSSDLSLLELTRAYAVYPRGGRRSQPVFIRKVTDRNGEVLMENSKLGEAGEVAAENAAEAAIDVASAPGEAETATELGDTTDLEVEIDPDQIISPELAYLTTALLRAVVVDLHGTGWRLKDLRRPVAGKTGTTNDQADAWFMGFSPEVVTGVWVGHDESRFLGYGETGSRAAAPIFVDFMAAALRDRPVRDFRVPDPIVFARVDRRTGLLADVGSKNVVFEAFLPGTEPTEHAEAARTSAEGRRMLRLDDF
jgi:penicillin-binding protein 1A